VITGEQVDKIWIEGNTIKAIQTNSRIIKDFKYVISAVPFYSLSRILQNRKVIPDPNFQYSSILNIHIWLKENNIDKTFYGLINSGIHWVFNHGSHLTIIRSDADELMETSKEEIYEFVKRELFKYLNIEENNISGYTIIKEKRATFIPSNDILFKRPGVETKLSNLFLAGDWIDTGLPSTIESAVKSGRMVADYFS
jgi:protoporphyrinogen oxidase